MEEHLNPEVPGDFSDDDERFIEAVNIGLAAADRGEFVEEDEVRARVEEILAGRS